MVLVLCIGDLNIPHRALDLPPKFKQLLVPGKIHRIVVTGNLCHASVQEYLRSLCGDVTITQGNFDEPGRWPETAVITVGDIKIGVTHGHQHIPWEDKMTAASVARRMDVDVLVMGHSPHFEAFQQEGRLILYPGTATGSFMPLMPLGSEDPMPSFALMDVNGPRATVYVYQLVEGNVKVDKIDFAARSREVA